MLKRGWHNRPDEAPKRFVYKILFVSRGDAARGQLAAALLRHVTGGAFGSFSAGLEPEDSLHPLTYVVLSELGLAPINRRPKSTLEVAAEGFDLVIVLGRDVSSVLPRWAGSATICWSYPSPDEIPEGHGERLKAFRALRDDLHQRLRALYSVPLEQLGSKADELSRQRFPAP